MCPITAQQVVIIIFKSQVTIATVHAKNTPQGQSNVACFVTNVFP